MAGGRTTPLALRDLAGLVVLNRISERATRQEHEYMDKWRNNLSRNAANIENEMSLAEVNAEEVICRVSKKLTEVNNRRVTRGTKRKAEEQSSSTRSNKKNANKSSEESTSSSSAFRIPFLLPFFNPQSKFSSIPEGVDEEEYICYRKCLFVEYIRKLREQLQSALTHDCIESLLQLVFRMEGRPKDTMERSQVGIFTLKAILFNSSTHILKLNHNDFHKNFRKPSFLLHDDRQVPRSIENRIGPTILRSSLANGTWLTHLSLSQTCTDGILESVGIGARNLKYLNITGSCVTDQGLFSLIGVENDGSLSRKHLSRNCKKKISRSESLVKGKNPRWIKLKDRGTDKLEHLEAFNLVELKWPSRFGRYWNCLNLPVDAGFIAILDFVPGLKVLHTEVACRAVQAFHQYQKINKKSATRNLNIESLTESRPDSELIECVAKVCPKLSQFTVLKKESFSGEEWSTSVVKFEQLKELKGSNIDLGSKWILGSLSIFGDRLTSLYFDEVSVFKYSFIKVVNDSCPQLTKLSIIMTNQKIGKIRVEKDADLRNITTKKSCLANLDELHLIGPLFSEYVKFLLAGVRSLRCLTLGVEWPDESVCNVGPENYSKDLLGKEYLQELRSINTLEDLEEIHFFAQYSRGSHKLTESFAIYLVNEFKKLKHLGTFQLWSKDLKPEVCVQMLHHINPSLTFDEQFSVPNNRQEKLTFTAKSFQDSSPYSCSWLNIKQQRAFSIFSELLVGQAFHWGLPMNDDEDNDDNGDDDMDDDDDSDSSSDIEDILQPLVNIEDDDNMMMPVLLNQCHVQ